MPSSNLSCSSLPTTRYLEYTRVIDGHNQHHESFPRLSLHATLVQRTYNIPLTHRGYLSGSACETTPTRLSMQLVEFLECCSASCLRLATAKGCAGGQGLRRCCGQPTGYSALAGMRSGSSRQSCCRPGTVLSVVDHAGLTRLSTGCLTGPGSANATAPAMAACARYGCATSSTLPRTHDGRCYRHDECSCVTGLPVPASTPASLLPEGSVHLR